MRPDSNVSGGFSFDCSQEGGECGSTATAHSIIERRNSTCMYENVDKSVIAHIERKIVHSVAFVARKGHAVHRHTETTSNE